MAAAARSWPPATWCSRPAPRSAPLAGVEIDEQRIVSSTGALELEDGAGASGGGRRRLHRPRARHGLAPARRQGHRGRVPGPDHARHGPRGVAPVPAPAVAPGPGLQARDQGHRGRRRRRSPAGHDRGGRRRRARADEGGRGAGRGRQAALHRRPRPRDREPDHRQPRPDRGRRPIRDRRPGHLRDRRRDPRADAGAQGRGRGRVRRRASGRPAAAHRLRCDPGRDLHRSRGRLGRQVRGAAQGCGHRVQDRKVPVLGQRPGARHRPDRRLRQGPGGCRRATACSASTSSAPRPAR